MEGETAKGVRTAAAAMALAVGLGAFGAHGLEDRLVALDRVDTWETASLYHLIHGLGLFVAAFLGRTAVFRLFLVGIIVFSGSLYTLAVTDIGWLGAITPIGGVCFLIGWILLMLTSANK